MSEPVLTPEIAAAMFRKPGEPIAEAAQPEAQPTVDLDDDQAELAPHPNRGELAALQAAGKGHAELVNLIHPSGDEAA